MKGVACILALLLALAAADDCNNINWWAATLSAHAYKAPASRGNLNALMYGTNNCWNADPWTIVVNQEHGFVARNTVHKLLFVVNRGSASAADWVNNIEVFRSSWEGGGSIHGGFKDQFNIMRAAVKAQVDAVKGDSAYKFYFTGHSLGASVAQIQAAAAGGVWGVGKARTHCITFGSPLVGNSDWASYYANNVNTQARHVLTNANRNSKWSPLFGSKCVTDTVTDLVTTVPPSSILGISTGYVHTAGQRTLLYKGACTSANSCPCKPQCMDAATSMSTHRIGPDRSGCAFNAEGYSRTLAW